MAISFHSDPVSDQILQRIYAAFESAWNQAFPTSAIHLSRLQVVATDNVGEFVNKTPRETIDQAGLPAPRNLDMRYSRSR